MPFFLNITKQREETNRVLQQKPENLDVKLGSNIIDLRTITTTFSYDLCLKSRTSSSFNLLPGLFRLTPLRKCRSTKKTFVSQVFLNRTQPYILWKSINNKNYNYSYMQDWFGVMTIHIPPLGLGYFGIKFTIKPQSILRKPQPIPKPPSWKFPF